MIEVRKVEVRNKGFSISDLDLSIQKGTFHSLIGPTGCGKTTLLEAILGLREVKKGSILLDGKDITNCPIHKRGFSYVPQDLAIFPHLTVRENIFFGIKYGKLNDKESKYKKTLELAQLLGITPILDRKAIGLSGGERQRVALVRSLATGRDYLLMDEPLSALHEGMKRQLWLLLKELQRRYNLTILMVSHDLEETFFLSDYITVMIEGKIQQTERKEVIYNHPINEKVADFFGIRNIFNGEIRGSNGGYFRVFCSDMNREFIVPIDGFNDKRESLREVKFGIRSHDIVMLMEEVSDNVQNVLEGNVLNIYDKGSSALVIFKPSNSEVLIEIDVPSNAIKGLAIRESSYIRILLPLERIFLFK